jgi:uncharacterized membrane protein YccC
MGVQEQDVKRIVIRGVVLAISCVLSYWLIRHILTNTYSISRDDDLLGEMWAVIATIFVYRYSQTESIRSALSRMAATFVSFVLCQVYLVLLPFHLWGMAALIGIGTVAVTLMGRADDTITTGITTTVIMVVADINPHDAWRQPILRMVDTTVGVAVGVAAAWMSSNWVQWSSGRRADGRSTQVIP